MNWQLIYAGVRPNSSDGWKLVLLNQFHDVLPGSNGSRKRIEANASYEEAASLISPNIEKAEIRVLYNGPIIAGIQVSRMLNNSHMTQAISLRRNSRRVEFKTKIDCKETHKLLKTAFPINYHAEEAIYEIQFGHVKHPNHKSRQYDMAD